MRLDGQRCPQCRHLSLVVEPTREFCENCGWSLESWEELPPAYESAYRAVKGDDFLPPSMTAWQESLDPSLRLGVE